MTSVKPMNSETLMLSLPEFIAGLDVVLERHKVSAGSAIAQLALETKFNFVEQIAKEIYETVQFE